jgi:hypothetical protein
MYYYKAHFWPNDRKYDANLENDSYNAEKKKKKKKNKWKQKKQN